MNVAKRCAHNPGSRADETAKSAVPPLTAIPLCGKILGVLNEGEEVVVKVEASRGAIEVSNAPFWHVVPVTGQWAWMFFNNVRVGRGELFSASVLSQAGGETANAASGYGGKTRDNAKEQEFERVRRERF